MSITALEILDEKCHVLHQLDRRLQPFNAVLGRLGEWGDSHCLRYVDPYGDTVFNRLQQVRLVDELELLKRLAQSPQESELLDDITSFVALARAEPHQYLRFVGE